jgi:DNA-directed RNA polymerase subunit beta'
VIVREQKVKDACLLRSRKCCWRSTPGEVTTQTPIKLRIQGDLIDLVQEHDPQDILRAVVQDDVRRVIKPTVGRVIFNDSIPAGLPFINGTLKKKGLQSLVNYSHIRLGHEMTVKMLDDLKTLGFLYATKAGSRSASTIW